MSLSARVCVCTLLHNMYLDSSWGIFPKSIKCTGHALTNYILATHDLLPNFLSTAIGTIVRQQPPPNIHELNRNPLDGQNC